jgi:peptide deformylase
MVNKVNKDKTEVKEVLMGMEETVKNRKWVAMEAQQIQIQLQLLVMVFLQLANTMFKKEDSKHSEQWVKDTMF